MYIYIYFHQSNKAASTTHTHTHARTHTLLQVNKEEFFYYYFGVTNSFDNDEDFIHFVKEAWEVSKAPSSNVKETWKL